MQIMLLAPDGLLLLSDTVTFWTFRLGNDSFFVTDDQCLHLFSVNSANTFSNLLRSLFTFADTPSIS